LKKTEINSGERAVLLADMAEKIRALSGRAVNWLLVRSEASQNRTAVY
jgi:hypothetical protein